MYEESLVKAAYHFPGISVLVPKQHGHEIVAIDNGSVLPEGFLARTDHFTLIRLVANIALVRKVDHDMGKLDPVTTFDPPIQIRVGYTISDVVEIKGNIRRLKLAYWDGNQWVIFNRSQHGYVILPPSTGQVAEVTLRSWVGDPPMGWGK